MSNLKVSDACSTYILHCLAPTTEECPLSVKYTFAILTIVSFGMFLTSMLGFSGTISLSRDTCFGLLGGGLVFCGVVFIAFMRVTVKCVVQNCTRNIALLY